MAQKITVRFPQPPQEYQVGQFNELTRSLEQMVLQLNNTYSNNIPENQANAMSWFLGGDSTKTVYSWNATSAGKIFVLGF